MTLPDTPLALASSFPAPNHEAWVALVEKTLKGGTVDSMTSYTRDGLEIQALYRDGPASDVRPGQRDPVRPWDIRTNIRHPDPTRANRDALSDLEGGAASLLVKIDPKGQSGVAVGSQADLARLLDGVLLDLAPVALNAGYLGPDAADWLGALAKGAPEAELYFHLDPITQFAQKGSSPGPIESHILHAATTAVRLGRTYPKAGLFLAAGRIAQEAGGTEAQELAFTLAGGLTYVKALVRAGATVDDAFKGVVLGASSTAEYFNTIAKLRALRLLWAKVAAASGADATRPARIETRSSFRMLTRLDAWTNLLRLASACVGSGIGGADAVVIAPFTEALGLPSPLARRQSRNIQLVLMEESHLGRVADPAGGAWFLETLTDQLARSAWAKFQAIEAQGGLIKSLESGLLQADIAEAAKAQAASVTDGKLQILGVTKFQNADLTPIDIETVDGAAFATSAPDPRKPGPDSNAAPLPAHRLSEQFEGA